MLLLPLLLLLLLLLLLVISWRSQLPPLPVLLLSAVFLTTTQASIVAGSASALGRCSRNEITFAVFSIGNAGVYCAVDRFIQPME